MEKVRVGRQAGSWEFREREGQKGNDLPRFFPLSFSPSSRVGFLPSSAFKASLLSLSRKPSLSQILSLSPEIFIRALFFCAAVTHQVGGRRVASSLRSCRRSLLVQFAHWFTESVTYKKPKCKGRNTRADSEVQKSKSERNQTENASSKKPTSSPPPPQDPRTKDPAPNDEPPSPSVPASTSPPYPSQP